MKFTFLIQVKYSEKKKSFGHFASGLCAIIGKFFKTFLLFWDFIFIVIVITVVTIIVIVKDTVKVVVIISFEVIIVVS